MVLSDQGVKARHQKPLVLAQRTCMLSDLWLWLLLLRRGRGMGGSSFVGSRGCFSGLSTPHEQQPEPKLVVSDSIEDSSRLCSLPYTRAQSARKACRSLLEPKTGFSTHNCFAEALPDPTSAAEQAAAQGDHS